MEFTKKPLILKIYGREVSLQKPTFGLVKQWEKRIADPNKGLEELGNMLLELGMPADLLEELEIEAILKIQDLLLPKKS